LGSIELRTFTEEEYHCFFRHYKSDPMMDPVPFRYNREQISRSYLYNHGGFRQDYAHYGIFEDGRPIGSYQLKRINPLDKTCEFGIILQNDSVKNRGIGSAAIMEGMRIAREIYGMKTIFGDTMGRNHRMIHVFEKLGFRLVEKIPDSFELPDGKKEDRLVYSKSLMEE
jgi:Acetyltransferases, including N-acetylases of ribosomal proteins